MRQWIELVEGYEAPSLHFYHVTDRDVAEDIIEHGFLGGWGDVGFGVYLYDNITEAKAYAEKMGWDAGLTDPVIIVVETNEAERVIPHPDWDQNKYQNMWWYDMEDDDEDTRWCPTSAIVS